MLFPLVAAGLFFSLLELTLRVVGYESFAYDPYESFVLHKPLFEVKESHVVTRRSRLKFFHGQTFPETKPPQSLRFFVFGGSVVHGYANPSPLADSFCEKLRSALADDFPNKRVEAVNCGGISYASYRLVDIVTECTDYSPDFFVAMTGNNEFLEPRHYGDLISERTSWKYAWLRLRVIQLIQQIETKIASLAGRHMEQLAGNEAVLTPEFIGERYIVRDEKEYDFTLEHYTRNLEKIIETCAKADIPLILCTLPSNIRHWRPFYTASRDESEAQRLRGELERLSDLMSRRRYEEALSVAEQVTKTTPKAAVFHFLAGECLDRLGRPQEAEKHYVAAKDTDAFPHRTLTSFNNRVRDMVRKYNVILFDGEKLFQQHAADGIPGNDLFADQCHPNRPGHDLLARGLKEVIEQSLEL